MYVTPRYNVLFWQFHVQNFINNIAYDAISYIHILYSAQNILLYRNDYFAETPKNTPAKHSFQNVDLMSPSPNRAEISRRSSVSSVTSDASSLFPMYESSPNLYHLQVCTVNARRE